MTSNRTIPARPARWAQLLGAASGLAIASGSAWAQQLGVGHLPTTGGIVQASEANAVSADGSTVVGSSRSGAGGEAVVWTKAGALTPLCDLSGGMVASVARGVSADGGVIVGYGTNLLGSQAVFWGGGTITPLGTLLGDTQSAAFAVSADGSVIVGVSGTRGFRWTQLGGMVALTGPGGASNLGGPFNITYARSVSADGNVVVGESDSTNLSATGSTEAFRWTQATGMVGLGALPGDTASRAAAVSGDGETIVGFSSSLLSTQAFRWSAGEGMVGLGFLPGGSQSNARAANYDGSVIVGDGNAGAAPSGAFYWTRTAGMRELAQTLKDDGVNLTGWQLWEARGVSADGGVVVGVGVGPSGLQEGYWARLSTTAMAGVTLRGLGDLPGGDAISDATAISDDGRVIAGYSSSAASGAGRREAVLWTATGGVRALGDLPGGNFYSLAQGVSDDGSVAVGLGTTATGYEAFRWEAGVMSPLGFLSGRNASAARDVSADGTVVVGTSWHLSAPIASQQAYRWTQAGGMIALGTLGGGYSDALDVSADGAVVVGASENASGAAVAFRWTQAGGMEALGFLSGGNSSHALAISGDGLVIVGDSDTGGPSTFEAFRWTQAEGMRSLGLQPGWEAARPYGVNFDGSVIVGEATTGPGIDRFQAFYWTAADGVKTLKDVLTERGVNMGAWRLMRATAVSGDGEFVAGLGQATSSSAPEAFWVRMPPPPPSGGGGASPPSPPAPPPVSGFLTQTVLAESATSTSAVLSSVFVNASLDGALSLASGAGPDSPVEVADSGAVTSDAGPLYSLRAGPRVGETRAWMLGGAHGFDGDMTDADAFDGAWGLTHQATAALRVGAGLRYTSIDGELPVYGGAAGADSYALLAFAAYEPGDSGWRLHAAASIGQSEAHIDRGYLNGVDPVTSSGERAGESQSGSAMLAYAFRLSEKLTLAPFVRFDATRFRLEAYEESGGPFPARFDEVEDTIEIARLGVEDRYALSRSILLQGSLALAQRGDDRLPAISGEVIGLTGFSYSGAEVDGEWVEASAGLAWRAGRTIDLRFNLAASTDGDTAPSGSATFGLEMRL